MILNANPNPLRSPTLKGSFASTVEKKGQVLGVGLQEGAGSPLKAPARP